MNKKNYLRWQSFLFGVLSISLLAADIQEPTEGLQAVLFIVVIGTTAYISFRSFLQSRTAKPHEQMFELPANATIFDRINQLKKFRWMGIVCWLVYLKIQYDDARVLELRHMHGKTTVGFDAVLYAIGGFWLTFLFFNFLGLIILIYLELKIHELKKLGKEG